MAKAKQPKPGDWRYQVEDLTAYERKDRGLAIYTRVLVGEEYREKKRLTDPIRIDGKIDPSREAAAIQLTVERQQRRAAGIEDVREGPLTIANAFARMMHPKDGKYAADSERKRSVKRYSTTIIRALDGNATMAADIKHGHYKKLWRYLAHEHVRSLDELERSRNLRESAKTVRAAFGPEAAVKIVGALRTLVSWLQQEELIEPGTGLPAETWKKSMRDEWVEITEQPIKDPAAPRYTVAEQVKLWKALPLADPRIEAAVQIGAELRLGQVPRSRRSDLTPYGEFEIGHVRVHGAGRKEGADLVLTDEQRAVLTRALTNGYLADFEAAYQAGLIKDYVLIPGGKMRTVKTSAGPQKRATMPNAMKAWERTPMRKAWQRLEALAGVDHVDGRNWYGLRRLSSDLAEDVESDDRVLNAQGGWTNSQTRRKYQEKRRKGIREKVATVRTKIRPNINADSDLQDNERGSK